MSLITGRLVEFILHGFKSHAAFPGFAVIPVEKKKGQEWPRMAAPTVSNYGSLTLHGFLSVKRPKAEAPSVERSESRTWEAQRAAVTQNTSGIMGLLRVTSAGEVAANMGMHGSLKFILRNQFFFCLTGSSINMFS